MADLHSSSCIVKMWFCGVFLYHQLLPYLMRDAPSVTKRKAVKDKGSRWAWNEGEVPSAVVGEKCPSAM